MSAEVPTQCGVPLLESWRTGAKHKLGQAVRTADAKSLPTMHHFGSLIKW